MPNENDTQERRGSGWFGLASSYAEFNLGWDTMKMVHQGSKAGYYVPWTREVAGRNSVISKAGQKLKFWGKEGFKLGTPNYAANALYRKEAMGGLRHSRGINAVVKSMSAEVGEKAAVSVARKSAASVLVGTAAGVGLRLAGLGMGVGLAWSIGSSLYGAASETVNKYRGLELGGYFPETQGAQTSRQRNLQAITASQLQARSAVGNEAMLFHR